MSQVVNYLDQSGFEELLKLLIEKGEWIGASAEDNYYDYASGNYGVRANYARYAEQATSADYAYASSFTDGFRQSKKIELTGDVTGTQSWNAIDGLSINTSISDEYATKADVATSISELVDGAPATLDTLDKLAAALKDNPDVVSALNAGLADKVNRAGDTMTGSLTVQGTITANALKKDATAAAIIASDSNEINFGSNGDYIYLGYDNRIGSPGAVSTYNFGRSAGGDSARDGDIYCGSVSAGRTFKVANAVTMEYNQTFECLNFSFS